MTWRPAGRTVSGGEYCLSGTGMTPAALFVVPRKAAQFRLFAAIDIQLSLVTTSPHTGQV